MRPPSTLLLACVLAGSWCAAGILHRASAEPGVGSPDEPVVKPVPPELAGRYYLGDGLGVNRYLEILEGGRYDFEWHGCLGLYGKSRGRAHLEEGWLVLTDDAYGPAADADSLHPFQIVMGFRRERLLPVPWGERIYLIEEEDIPDFCRDVNLGDEPRPNVHGFHYLRENDWDRPAPEAPQLPEAWLPYLLEGGIAGHVVELLDDRSGWIDLGSEDRLLAGMQGQADAFAEGTYGRVVVTILDTRSALVQTTYDDDRLAVGQPVAFSLPHEGRARNLEFRGSFLRSVRWTQPD